MNNFNAIDKNPINENHLNHNHDRIMNEELKIVYSRKITVWCNFELHFRVRKFIHFRELNHKFNHTPTDKHPVCTPITIIIAYLS